MNINLPAWARMFSGKRLILFAGVCFIQSGLLPPLLQLVYAQTAAPSSGHTRAKAPSRRGASTPTAPSAEDKPVVQPTPPSRLHKQIKIDKSVTRRLPPPPRQRDAPPTNKAQPLAIGIAREISPSLSPLQHAKWFTLGQQRGQVAVMAIVSEGAAQLRAQFTNVNLPAGAQLFVSSLDNRAEFYGPYTGRGPTGDGTFWTPPVTGEGIIIEYVTKDMNDRTSGATAPFAVSQVSHVFPPRGTR